MEYVYKYLGNRQCDISNIAPEDIDDCFRVLREVFTEEWLTDKGQNVIQKLWKTVYNLATIELYSVGYAIRSFLSSDPKFIAEKVALIKTNDPKNINGALFEIIALNAYKFANKTTPARVNQAGYDGKIELKENKSIRLSIKNYSISVHHANFLKECDALKALTKKYLKGFNCKPLEILINRRTIYPSDADWTDLKTNYHGVFVEYNKHGKHFFACQIGDWSVTVHELIATEKLSEAQKSYTLIISSHFHKNEEKNLFDKLEEACANLIKHEKTETADEKNMIIIHLPRIANRKNCEQWVRQYFEDYPDKPLSAVLLLQPLVLKNSDKDSTYISMGMSFIYRDQIIKDFERVLPIDMAFPVGRAEGAYPQHIIFLRETNETAFQIDLEDCYVYQHGDHYYDAVAVNGGAESFITKVASGIFRHSVVTIFGQKVVIEGQFEPTDQLELL